MKISIWVVRVAFVGVAMYLAWTLGDIIASTHSSGGPEMVQQAETTHYFATLVSLLVGLLVAGSIVTLDVLFQKKTVATIVSLVLAIIVGVLLEWMVSRIVQVSGAATKIEPNLWSWIELTMLVLFCYVAITTILQTREDFRLVIPYVKLSQEGQEVTPFVLDTSVIIDGRIADIAETGVLDNTLVVPRFVLNELQGIADSADRLKRNRGRRGLDILKRLQECKRTRVELRDILTETEEAVDTKLIRTSKAIRGRVVTNDFNLNKIAQLQDVEVININDLAQALRPVVLPGEEMEVKILRPGEEAGQGVGYLEDGTMVVVEQGREMIGQKAVITVNNVYQTSAGRMIFGRPSNAPPKNAPPPRKAPPQA